MRGRNWRGAGWLGSPETGRARHALQPVQIIAHEPDRERRLTSDPEDGVFEGAAVFVRIIARHADEQDGARDAVASQEELIAFAQAHLARHGNVEGVRLPLERGNGQRLEIRREQRAAFRRAPRDGAYGLFAAATRTSDACCLRQPGGVKSARGVFDALDQILGHPVRGRRGKGKDDPSGSLYGVGKRASIRAWPGQRALIRNVRQLWQIPHST